MQTNSVIPQSAVTDIYKPSHRSTFATNRQENAASASPQDKVSLSPRIRTGIDNVRSLGILALGGQSQIDAWERQGLTISDETIQAAFDVLNTSFREHMNNTTQGISFNRYQIIANSQPVPDWFRIEQEVELAAISNEDIRTAFSSGKFYHSNYAASDKSAATNLYQRINNS